MRAERSAKEEVTASKSAAVSVDNGRYGAVSDSEGSRAQRSCWAAASAVVVLLRFGLTWRSEAVRAVNQRVLA